MAEETPWAALTRLKQEGRPFEEAVPLLAAHELTSDDVATLINGAPEFLDCMKAEPTRHISQPGIGGEGQDARP